MRCPCLVINCAAALTISASPLFASTYALTVKPCSADSGSPCNGHNRNLGVQTDAEESGRPQQKDVTIELTIAAVAGREAYITQIGDSQVATILQNAPNAYAHIYQSGTHNEANVTQKGSGTASLSAIQTGSNNFARVFQNGSGKNMLSLAQNGVGNWAWSKQEAIGAVFNGAILTQTGNGNDIALTQNGSDNRALLTQNGNDNGMSAVQNGEGNRLEWIQIGNGLPDLAITQSGGTRPGGQIAITQASGY